MSYTTHVVPVVKGWSLPFLRNSARPFSRVSSTWQGRHPSEHVTNQDHEHNIHAEAANKGKKAKEADQAEASSDKQSAATSQRDVGGAAKAEAEKSGRKDRGMGLQDERGGVSTDRLLYRRVVSVAKKCLANLNREGTKMRPMIRLRQGHYIGHAGVVPYMCLRRISLPFFPTQEPHSE